MARVLHPAWLQALLILASLKIAGFPGFVLDAPGADPSGPFSAPFPTWIYATTMAVFVALGGTLLAGGRRDVRARWLGAVFLVTASMFAERPLGRVAASMPSTLGLTAGVLRELDPGAFRPLLLWTFASLFPRPASGFCRTLARTGQAVGLIVGVGYFATGVVMAAAAVPAFSFVPPAPIAALSAHRLTINTPLTLLALPLVFLNTRAAGPAERRRAHVFVTGLLVGFGPILAQALAEGSIPAYGAFMDRPSPRFWSGVIFYPLLFGGLTAAAYAVYVSQVLSVRLVIRKALRYALERATILALMAVPFGLLFAFLYEQRSQPIGELFTGTRQLTLVALIGAGFVVLRLRRRLLAALDRRYFREQYDARQILTSLIEESRSADSVGALAAELTSEIDRALHLERIVLFVGEPARRVLSPVGAACDPLSYDSPLATLLGGSAEPMDVDMRQMRDTLRRLPGPERRWLQHGGYHLLVPIVAASGSLTGLVALGPKKSELPFSPEDRRLLSAIAASAAIVIENLAFRAAPSPVPAHAASPGSSHPAATWAAECDRCGTVQEDTGAPQCHCGGHLLRAPVPRTVRGFTIERRIGVGGMGVVYRAIDENLRRRVAIKTLPRLSAIEARRLRHEARAMAALTHPNLATIFAVEMWHDLPMLIVEYFEGGTLRDRLIEGPLGVRTVLELGGHLVGGLAHMHHVGLLHRDIKPSNIGFTAAGSAKLLDFGLAVALPSRLAAQPLPSETTSVDSAIATRIGTADHMVGTPHYFSPEIVALEPPDHRSDLWALSLVLYQAIAGSNPMAAGSTAETLERISRGHVPDLSSLRPECPAYVARFFARALSADPRDRPKSAADLQAGLYELAVTIDGLPI